ncbi:MFS transporter, partial [Cellulomonas bogoriensis 69B4 = DSM 16987]
MTDPAKGLGRSRLRRDRLTLSLYAPFITWGWFLYGFSPAVPLIAEEQGISRGQAGLHGTAMAVGTIGAGFISSTIAVRYGRKVQSVLGAGILVAGLAMLAVGTTLVMTLPAVVVIALGGNLALSAAQPALAVHHGPAGPAAVTEANAVGATFGLLAPVALGFSVDQGWGWRPAVVATMLFAALAALLVAPLRTAGGLGRGTATPRPAAGQPANARFSVLFWLFWAAMLCGIAVEFSTAFWAPDLLVQRTGAPTSLASASVSALVIGMSVSRFIVGPLSTRKAPEKLLLAAFAVAAVGWAVFWLATTPALAIVGLVVAGLGYGAHYPLSIALALRASGGRPDQAQARCSMGGGAAVGVAPFALG